jgi:putative tryptophan/tyrosine transport system substrate-binding protein
MRRRPKPSLPGLTRQSIFFRKKMDARGASAFTRVFDALLPAHDGLRTDAPLFFGRRQFIALLGAAAAAWPRAARAQQGAKVARIGYLVAFSLESPEGRPMVDAFWQGLRERGYVEGQNIVIEYRSADSRIERFPQLANELASLNLDLILANNTPAARAVQRTTSTIPIVVPVMGDPVADGLVASLARPGGNITGLTFLGPELASKRLGLLKQALPNASRVGALWHPGAYGERTTREMLQGTEAAARTLAVELQLVEVRGPDEFERAFSAITGNRADALLVLPSAMFFNEGKQIVDLAMKHRLPSMSMARELAKVDGLMAYGASLTDLQRRGATYVDKILKGAKPADLPVEQPTKFEFVLNLKTAKALGLTIAESFQLLADEVIE